MNKFKFNTNTKASNITKFEAFLFQTNNLTFIYHITFLNKIPILYFCSMKNFWKLIVFIGLLMQFGFAYGANHDETISFSKENNSEINKESLSTSHFVLPSIERSNPDLKHNNRIPVGLIENTVLLLFFDSRESNLKIVLSDQDLDRYNSVSILLFPFHIFW